MTHMPECTCPLIDTSTWGGKPSFHRGNPRGSGCPIHETEAMRNEIKVAEHLARYGDAVEPVMTYTVCGVLPFAYLTDEQIAAMGEDVGEMSGIVAAIIREAGANLIKARQPEETTP